MRISTAIVLGLMITAIVVVTAVGQDNQRALFQSWHTPDKLGEITKVAAERDIPVAVIYRFRESDCGLHNAKVRAFKRIPEVASMLKVEFFTDVQERNDFRKIEAEAFTFMLPVLLISDGEGHLLGFCAYESSPQEVTQITKQAVAAMLWKRNTRGTLKNLEQAAEKKEYPRALAQLKTVETQDLLLTDKLRKTTWQQSEKARVTYRQRMAKEPASLERDKAAYEEKLTEGVFFATETKAIREKLQESIKADIAEAEKLLDDGGPRKAGQALAPLVRLKVNEEIDTQISDLHKRIQAAIREKA